ncbi:uncharacterized protein LOC134291842 isoform X2 [Aedes albopictus]|uniref:Secreted protein n=1 Tax=Aedes albopictus TaxID=7160 RepID=A0ABM1Z7L8_AEDAL
MKTIIAGKILVHKAVVFKMVPDKHRGGLNNGCMSGRQRLKPGGPKGVNTRNMGTIYNAIQLSDNQDFNCRSRKYTGFVERKSKSNDPSHQHECHRKCEKRSRYAPGMEMGVFLVSADASYGTHVPHGWWPHGKRSLSATASVLPGLRWVCEVCVVAR